MEERVKAGSRQSVNRTLTSLTYKRQVKGYAEWLNTLGYAKSTVYAMPGQLKEFLAWLETRGVLDEKNITATDATEFIDYFTNRPNQRKPGGLSISHINKQIDAMQKFFRYLKSTGQANLNITLKQIKETERPERTILSQEEIKLLYGATDNSPIGMRDRAMLAVYYGCGLRKAEGLALEIQDILFERRLLYVRKTKNGYKRYVPINLNCLQDLETYIYTARPLLINDTEKTEALFISEKGRPIQQGGISSRLNALKEKIPQLQNKDFGLHALRHSIATHLLQAGMELENIALFLGHKTLDSTQIYTHLVNHSLGEG